jgi:hypothetical protein
LFHSRASFEQVLTLVIGGKPLQTPEKVAANKKKRDKAWRDNMTPEARARKAEMDRMSKRDRTPDQITAMKAQGKIYRANRTEAQLEAVRANKRKCRAHRTSEGFDKEQQALHGWAEKNAFRFPVEYREKYLEAIRILRAE